jgi:hypothetical protein
MLSIIIKNPSSKSGSYATTLMDKPMEKKILSPDVTEDKAKQKIAKEFNTTPEMIIRYWPVED